MQKIFVLLFVLVSNTAVIHAQRVVANAITGQWLTASKDGKVFIYEEGGKYFGKINSTKTPGAKDDKNPNPDLRKNTLLGTIILKDFVFNGKDKWESGTIYDPHNGKTYSCNIKLKNDKELEVRGYIGVSLFGRTETWTR